MGEYRWGLSDLFGGLAPARKLAAGAIPTVVTRSRHPSARDPEILCVSGAERRGHYGSARRAKAPQVDGSKAPASL